MQPPETTLAPPGGRGKHSSYDFVDRALVLATLAGARRVLDLGCGRGDWSLALARVGTPVLAVDRWREGLQWLRLQAGSLPLHVLEADLGAPLPLADGAADGALLSLVLHHLASRGKAPGLLTQIARVLAPGGLLAIIEFLPVAPPPGPPLAVRLSPALVLALAADAGLVGDTPRPIADHIGLYLLRKPA
ncbi:class I SAM-dependent methyltransferase [Immundisolibacter sp.]